MKTNEKDTEQGVVPALRFPEFRKNAEWNIPHLNQISTRITTKVGYSTLLPVSISAGVGFVAQTKKFGRDISGEQYQNYIELNRGEFAYNKGNSKKYPQGCVYRLEEFDSVAAPNAFLCFRFDDSVIPDFFKGYFDSNYHGKQLQNVITSGARSNGLLNISADEFFNIILPTPKDKAEQQKIADCLSSIDALIKATENKIGELKAHKKGLMQRLFPAEGKTIPKIRFPEFQNTGEWVYLEGDKVFEPISNRKHSSNLPVLAISQEHGAIPRDLIDYNVIVSESGLENYKVVEVGDFIISLRSFQGGIEYSNYKGICSPAYIILRKRLDVDNQFFKCYFKSRAFIRDLNKNLEGIRDGKMVSYKQFSEILLPIPSIHNKKEQQKIADCLSSADDLILAQTNRLEALKTHKKGLMQQLFPNINDC